MSNQMLVMSNYMLVMFNKLVASKCTAFSVDNSLFDDLVNNWVNKDFLNNWCIEDLGHDVLPFLDISNVRVLLSDDRLMSLFDEGGMLLVDDGLMVLMNVFLIDDGLVVLVNDVLMMFMQNVFFVLNKHILVMLMDNVLMNFLHNSSISVGLTDINLVSSKHFASLVERSHDSLFLMSDHDGCLINFLNDCFSSSVDLLVLVIVLEYLVVEVLSMDEIYVLSLNKMRALH